MEKEETAQKSKSVAADLRKRWLELDDEAEAEIAQMPQWLRPIARILSKGFGWRMAIVPLSLLFIGLIVLARLDNDSDVAQFSTIDECLDWYRNTHPDEVLQILQEEAGEVIGTLRPSGQTYRCETIAGEDEAAYVLASKAVEPSDARPMQGQSAAASENDEGWSIRDTSFLDRFERPVPPPVPEEERFLNLERQRKLAEQVAGRENRVPRPPMLEAAGNGHCIAGCAEFANGFYDIE